MDDFDINNRKTASYYGVIQVDISLFEISAGSVSSLAI